MAYRSIDAVLPGNPNRWQGKAFYVKEYFPMNQPYEFYQRFSPFLQLDYQDPYFFIGTPFEMKSPPSAYQGLGLACLLLAGELSLIDNAGFSKDLEPGDFHYLRTGTGLFRHKQQPSPWTKKDRILQYVELSINLPPEQKKSAPHGELLKAKDAGYAYLGDAGEALIYLGEAFGSKSPLTADSPVNLYKISLEKDAPLDLEEPAHHHLAILVLAGYIQVNETDQCKYNDLVIFKEEAAPVRLTSLQGTADLLVISGQGLNQTVVHIGGIATETPEEMMASQEALEQGSFEPLA